MVTEIVKDVKVPQAALNVSAHETGDMCRTPVAEEEEEVGIPIPIDSEEILKSPYLSLKSYTI